MKSLASSDRRKPAYILGNTFTYIRGDDQQFLAYLFMYHMQWIFVKLDTAVQCRELIFLGISAILRCNAWV